MTSSENQRKKNIKGPLLSSDELFKFCDEFNLSVELEKPFDELDGFIIKITEDNIVIKEALVESMSDYQTVAGTILNKLSQNYPKR